MRFLPFWDHIRIAAVSVRSMSIFYTRFGDVSLEKWSQKMGEGADGVSVALEGKWTPL